MASLIHDIIKYTVLILCLINVVLIAFYLIDGLLNKKNLSNETMVYLILMLIIFIVGAYAAHTEDFLYLIIFGVVIVVGLAVGFLVKFQTMGQSVMVLLAVLVFIFALIIKRGGI